MAINFNKRRANSIFNPAFVSNLQLWLDAVDVSTITLNGSDVSNWADKSGNGNDLAQATAVEQPEYKTDQINGLNGVFFDKANEERLASSSVDMDGKDVTVFIVSRYTDLSRIDRASLFYVGGTPFYFIDIPHTSEKMLTAIWTGSVEADNIVSDSVLEKDQDYLFTFVYDNTGNISYQKRDQITQADTSTTSVAANFNGPITLGNHPSADRAPTMSYGEVLVYNKTLNVNEMSQVETYLIDKWGIDFNPAKLSGLTLWLDADDSDTITLNGSDVSQWDDKSVSGNNATQSTANDQPLYDTASINNKNAVYFDGVSEFLDLDSLTSVTNDFTIFVVIEFDVAVSNPTNTTPAEGILGDSVSDPTPRGWLFTGEVSGSASQETLSFGSVDGAGQGGIEYLRTNIAAVPKVISGRLTGTGMSIQIDGVNQTVFEASSGIQPGELFQFDMIGAHAPTPANFLAAKIGEIVHYDRSLTDDERTAVTNYLKAKWGI